MDKENWKREYESGKTTECLFCGGEHLEHTCRSCYSGIAKEICWKHEGYCVKCFVHIHEEIPKIDALKKEMGVKCQCNDPSCVKCLIVNCEDDNCPVHTTEQKAERRRKKDLK